MARSGLGLITVLGLVLMLGGCQLGGPGSGKDRPGSGKDGPAPNAIAGDPIEVTALDPVSPAEPAKPVPTAATTGQTGPDGPDAAPAGAETATDPAKTAETAETAEPATPVAPKSPQARACERKGGNYVVAGKSGANTCVKPTGEGARQCSRKTDCTGQCLARSGTCAPVSPLFGCNDILQADGSRVTLCID